MASMHTPLDEEVFVEPPAEAGEPPDVVWLVNGDERATMSRPAFHEDAAWSFRGTGI